MIVRKVMRMRTAPSAREEDPTLAYRYCMLGAPKVSESILGFRTIKDGEQALILNNQGRARLVVGPQRIRRNYLRSST